MSEAGHGSDVQQLQTTATYDPTTESFVIQTPTERDHKEYIGNAARDGRMAAVFAQLIVGGEHHGVHALVVPIRDDDGKPAPGVRIEDCGEKMGLNGVDNGRLWFDEVRVPREALLNRYGDVSADGVYSSPIENAGRRFFTMLGHARPGTGVRAPPRGQRRQERADDRRPLRAAPAPVRARGRGRGPDPRLPHPPAAADAAAGARPTRCTSPRPS